MTGFPTADIATLSSTETTFHVSLCAYNDGAAAVFAKDDTSFSPRYKEFIRVINSDGNNTKKIIMLKLNFN